jgi:hypothetical protein
MVGGSPLNPVFDDLNRHEARVAMRGLLHRSVALVAGIATFYFVGLFGAAILSIVLSAVVSALLAFLGSATGGVLVARYVSKSPDLLSKAQGPNGARVPSLLRSAATGAVLLGGIGFCAGFLGPMVLWPESNQGPLLGIFVTGPLGVVVGAVWGYVYNLGQRATP